MFQSHTKTVHFTEKKLETQNIHYSLPKTLTSSQKAYVQGNRVYSNMSSSLHIE